MLYVLSLIGMSILLILLQLWLSSKKSVFPGLALIAAAWVVFLSLTVWTYSLDAVSYTHLRMSCKKTSGLHEQAWKGCCKGGWN